MHVVLRTSMKDRGSITWPPEQLEADDLAGLRAAIVKRCDATRDVLGVTYVGARVHVNVTYRPDITVEGM